MHNEQFSYLMPPPESKWAKARRITFWTAYCLSAVSVSIGVLLMTENFWHSFVTIGAFIFGPRLWRKLM